MNPRYFNPVTGHQHHGELINIKHHNICAWFRLSKRFLKAYCHYSRKLIYTEPLSLNRVKEGETVRMTVCCWLCVRWRWQGAADYDFDEEDNVPLIIAFDEGDRVLLIAVLMKMTVFYWRRLGAANHWFWWRWQSASVYGVDENGRVIMMMICW